MSKIKIQEHFIIGFIVSFTLYFFFGYNVIILFLSNILLDIDHYLNYIIKFRSFNLIKSYNNSKNENKTTLCIFHTIEFIAIIYFLSIYFNFVYYILLGSLLHIMTDSLDHLIKFKNVCARYPSIIIWSLKKDKIN